MIPVIHRWELEVAPFALEGLIQAETGMENFTDTEGLKSGMIVGFCFSVCVWGFFKPSTLFPIQEIFGNLYIFVFPLFKGSKICRVPACAYLFTNRN